MSLRLCWTSYTQVRLRPNAGAGDRADLLMRVFAPPPPGSISVNVENVQELMVAADMLQLSEVVSICGEFLKGHMDPFNCVGIFQFLEQIACLNMLEYTENYIHVHFLEVQAFPAAAPQI